MPLYSHRHAEFIHHELGGVSLPDAVRERMRLAGDNGLAEGMAIARELLEQVRGKVTRLPDAVVWALRRGSGACGFHPAYRPALRSPTGRSLSFDHDGLRRQSTIRTTPGRWSRW